MTYQCLPSGDLMLFMEIAQFTFGFASDSFMELVSQTGRSFFWQRLEATNIWCILGSGVKA